MSRMHAPRWQRSPCRHSKGTLSFTPLGLGNSSPDLSKALGFCESRFPFLVPSPSRCGSACAPEGAALCPLLRTGVTILTASSHKCPWAESDLTNEMPAKSGNSWKRPFSWLSTLVKWHLFLGRLQTARTVVATFKNSPGERLNCSLTSSKL